MGKEKKGSSKMLLLIPLAMFAILAVSTILLALVAFLIFAPSLSTGSEETPNKLYIIARDAPSASEAIAYVDVKKAMENEYIVREMGLEEAQQAAFLFGYAGMAKMGEQQIVIIEGAPIEFAAALAPSALGLVGLLSDDAPKMVTLDYRGDTICIAGDTAYLAKDGKVMLSDEATLKKALDSKGSSAEGEFESVMSKLENDDVMAALKYDIYKIGLTASLEGEVSHMRVIVETPNEGLAQTYAPFVSMYEAEGIEVKSVKVDGKFIHIEVDAELEKLKDFTMPGTDTEVMIEPPGPDEPVVPDTDELPCQTEEECREYCAENPEECEEIIESYAKSPCCAECLKAFAESGRGPESVTMPCSSFELSSNCTGYFEENPHVVMGCYNG